MMRSSPMTTLFEVATPPPRGAYSILVSTLLHSIGFALLLHGLGQTPRIEVRPVLEPYVVRLLNLSRRESEKSRRIDTGVAYPGSRAFVGTDATELHGRAVAPVLLVQPEAPADHLLARAPPIPDMVIWSAEHTPSPIVSARPQPAI
jgi:hypothetical protein